MYSIKRISYLFLLFFIANSCKSQDIKTSFNYKKIKNSWIYNVNVEKSLAKIKFVDLVSYLPENYVRNGSVDYRDYIQKGIEENQHIKLPDFPILISGNGLMLRSNSIIYFNKNSKLILASNSLPKYQILDIRNVKNIIIYNPRLVGDRFNHKGTMGEWGMGINIISSSDISIYNPEIKNCWGDAIYINGFTNNESENIKIEGGYLDCNRRNGISIISGKKIYINNIFISNTHGTLPMAGIDIEPNENSNTLERIKLYNVNTYNNGDAGIAIILLNMIGKKYHKVDVCIDSHHDAFSKYAMIMGGSKTGYKYPDYVKPLGGAVEIINSQWNDNTGRVSIAADFKYSAIYEFSNLKVKNNGKVDVKETASNIRKIKEEGFKID